MRVLVTGASGFLGANLVRHLLAGGDKVTALVRSPLKGQPLKEQGAELAIGDITDERALRAALREIEIVYHLAGKLMGPGAKLTEFQRTHVEGTRLLLALCKEQAELKRFVHTSTTGILGPTGDHAVDELTPPNPVNAYEDTKWQAELAVRDAIAAGFPAVIARPAFVYGPGDLHLLGFFRSIQKGWFRPIGKRDVLMHPIFIDDMSLALMACGQQPRATGQCFHFAGKPTTLRQLAETIADAFGVDRPRGILPLALAQIAAKIGDTLPGRLGTMAPMTSSRLAFLTHSRVYDTSHAAKSIGYVAPTDLVSGITQTVDWYSEHGYLGKILPKTSSGQTPQSN